MHFSFFFFLMIREEIEMRWKMKAKPGFPAGGEISHDTQDQAQVGMQWFGSHLLFLLFVWEWLKAKFLCCTRGWDGEGRMETVQHTHTVFSPISLFLMRAYPLWPLLLLFFLIFTLLYFALLILLLLLAVFNDVMTGRVFIMLQLPVLSPSNNSPVSGKVWQSNLFLDCETDHEAEKKVRRLEFFLNQCWL